MSTLFIITSFLNFYPQITTSTVKLDVKKYPMNPSKQVRENHICMVAS